MASAAASDRRTSRAWWQVGRFIIGLGLGALALLALNGQRNELVGASAALANLRVEWLLAAIAFEFASFTSFGALQRRLLFAGGVRVDLRYMTELSLAAGAISNSIPAGPAFASVYAFRLYRRRGADDAIAGWTLIATLVCAAFALALVASTGLLLAVHEATTYDLVGVSIGALLISLLADAVVLQRRWLAWVVIVVLHWTRRIFGRPRRTEVEIVEGLLEHLAAVRLGWHDFLATISFGLGNWIFDCSALACSFLAVGVGVPWRGLLLAYGAGQLAANLPITPGGLGVVEGSLTVALVAFGGAELSTVSAVLCYRIVSFWGFLPIGWMSWGVLAVRQRRHSRALATGASNRAEGRLGFAPGNDPLLVSDGLTDRSEGEP